MSAYSTRDVTRAERMVQMCRLKKDRSVKALSDDDLNSELHDYVYSERYTDIVGLLYNYNIK